MLVLRCKNALLGKRVILKAAVPVEVVGGDVEDDGDRWGGTAQCDSSWKLETSSTDQVASVDSSMSATTGTPMLPPTSVGNAGLLQNFAQQRRCGGLAVGAGDGE